MTHWSLLVAAVVLARQAAAGGGAVVQGDVVRDPDKGGVDADVTVEYDPNATTTATTPDILLNPDLLVAPAPFPSPAPNAYYDVEPPLPAPSSESPAPGPEGHWQIDTCTVQRGCNGMSCDMFEGTSCAVLEASFDCDCTSCRCALDRQSENAPAPPPQFDGVAEEVLSHKCTADCVSEGTSCDYWEFNTCDFLESSKGCDCSGCQCTGGTCESEHADDTDQPECEDWCGNTMAKWESCEYCRCKACDFCVVGEDGETAADQLVRSGGAGRGAVLTAAAATVAAVAAAWCQ